MNEKPTIKIIGTDGNIFSLLSLARRRFRELKKEEPEKDWDKINKEFMKRVTTRTSYDEALNVFSDQFEVI